MSNLNSQQIWWHDPTKKDWVLQQWLFFFLNNYLEEEVFQFYRWMHKRDEDTSVCWKDGDTDPFMFPIQTLFYKRTKIIYSAMFVSVE